MTQRRGYGSTNSGRSSDNSTSSRYEEALRRSNDRISNIQRSSRRANDMQQSLRYDDDDPRAQRYMEERPRRTIRLDDSFSDGQGYGNAPRRAQPQLQRTQENSTWQGATQHSRDSRSQHGYYEQQMQNHGRESAQYQARRIPFVGNMPAQESSQRGMIIRAAICAVLLIICIVSFMRIGPATGARGSAETTLQQKQEELVTANSKNSDLQNQLENMKTSIDKYNELVAKS